MSDERAEKLGEVRARALEASEAMEVQAAEVLDLTKRIEELTDGTPGWYPGMRTRVEAAEARRQAHVLVRTLRHLNGDANRASEDAFQDG